MSSHFRSRHQAFTLIELLVVISIIALLIGILLPALGASRRTARQIQNTTQIRGIHTSLVLFAQGNGGYYPGRTATGVATLFNSNDGHAVEPRFRKLLEDQYFTGAYAISSAETQGKTVWTTGEVTTEHYSYALLEIVSGGNRRSEWRDTSNAEAPVITDRAILYQEEDIRSVHTNPASGSDWRGSVGWNDNHVTFEAQHTGHRTRYGSATEPADHLFVASDDSTDNALLIYQDEQGVYDDQS